MTRLKQYGNEPTRLTLTDKASAVYANTDPVSIYEYEKDGQTLYKVAGVIERTDLTQADVNELFESLEG